MNCRLAFFGAVIVILLHGNTPSALAQIDRIGVDEALGLSKAVVLPSSNLAITSQISPLDPSGKLIGSGDVALQAQTVLGFLESILEKELRATPGDVAKINVYAASDAVVPIVRMEIAKTFLKEQLPAVSFVITPLRVADAQVAIDAVIKQTHTGPMPAAKGAVRRQAIASIADANGKKSAIGRYGMPADRAGDSVSIWGNRLILVSGQAEPGEFRESIGKTWKSLVKTVEWAGGNIDSIGQIKVFMNSIDEAQVVMDEIAKISYIKEPDEVLPAFSFVQWTNKGATEIEVVAAQSKEIDNNSEPVRHLNPPWMTESPVYCKVAVTNSDRLIFTSGLYGTPGADSETQVNSMFTELDRLMKECGSDLKHLAKATYYVANDDVSGKLTTLRPKYYDPKHPPAASKASVTGVGMEKCTITLDMIAVPIAK